MIVHIWATIKSIGFIKYTYEKLIRIPIKVKTCVHISIKDKGWINKMYIPIKNGIRITIKFNILNRFSDFLRLMSIPVCFLHQYLSFLRLQSLRRATEFRLWSLYPAEELRPVKDLRPLTGLRQTKDLRLQPRRRRESNWFHSHVRSQFWNWHFLGLTPSCIELPPSRIDFSFPIYWLRRECRKKNGIFWEVRH